MFPTLPKKPRSFPRSMQPNSDRKAADSRMTEIPARLGSYLSLTNSDLKGKPDSNSSRRPSERDDTTKVPDPRSKGNIRKLESLPGASQEEVRKLEGESPSKSGQKKVQKQNPRGESPGKSRPKEVQKQNPQCESPRASRPNEVQTRSSPDGVDIQNPKPALLPSAYNLSVAIYHVAPGEVGIRLPSTAPPTITAPQYSLFLRTATNPDHGISSEFHHVCGRYLYTESRQSLPPRQTPGFHHEEPLAFIDPADQQAYLDVVGDDCIRDGPHPWNARKWVLEVLERLAVEGLLRGEEYRGACRRVSGMAE